VGRRLDVVRDNFLSKKLKTTVVELNMVIMLALEFNSRIPVTAVGSASAHCKLDHGPFAFPKV
jgi:hypothetical protein